MKSNEETLKDLKREVLRIGSTSQRDNDLLKKKGHVLSTTICRRLKLSWPEVVKKLDGKANTSVIISKNYIDMD